MDNGVDRIKKIWAKAKRKSPVKASSDIAAEEKSTIGQGKEEAPVDSDSQDGHEVKTEQEQESTQGDLFEVKPAKKKSRKTKKPGLSKKKQAKASDSDQDKSIDKAQGRPPGGKQAKKVDKRVDFNALQEIEGDLHKWQEVIKNTRVRLLESQKVLMDSQDTVKTKKQEIGNLKNNISELEKINDDYRKHIKNTEELLREKDEKGSRLIIEKEQKITGLQEALNKMGESIQIKEGRVSELEDNIEALNKKLVNIGNDQKKAKDHIKEKDQAIAELKDTIKSIKSEDRQKAKENASHVAERDAEIFGLKKYITVVEEALVEKDAEIAGRQRKIGEIEDALEGKDTVITELGKNIDIYDENLLNYESALENLIKYENELKTLKESIKKKEKIISELSKMVKAFENSDKIKDEENEDIIARKDAEITGLKKAKAGLEKDIKAGAELGEARDKEIAALKADVLWDKELNEAFKTTKTADPKKEIALAEMESEIAKLRAEISSLRELAFMQKSYIEGIENAANSA